MNKIKVERVFLGANQSFSAPAPFLVHASYASFNPNNANVNFKINGGGTYKAMGTLRLNYSGTPIEYQIRPISDYQFFDEGMFFSGSITNEFSSSAYFELVYLVQDGYD